MRRIIESCPPQDPFGLEDSADGKGLRVIFNTNLLSKKVVQMRNQPQCSLLFFNPKKLEFVSERVRASRLRKAMQSTYGGASGCVCSIPRV